jgi:hypothetical protein
MNVLVFALPIPIKSILSIIQYDCIVFERFTGKEDVLLQAECHDGR